ncbi:hypothetical protein ACEWY4_019039 [Coilia grayii]|uniref:Chemokine interleukin-8-like domain-containing protein n=1 Tax=Coilia grayii TaxID=363190 RepID=A0ABD1JG40_9TELE
MQSTLPGYRWTSLCLLATVLLTCISEQTVAAKQLMRSSPIAFGGAKHTTMICCHRTSPARIRTEINGCIIQSQSDACVAAVIFKTNGTYYCTSPNARWVKLKMLALAKNHKSCSPA